MGGWKACGVGVGGGGLGIGPFFRGDCSNWDFNTQKALIGLFSFPTLYVGNL